MSLWEEYTNNVTFAKLENNLEVDTLIIGGGIAGVTTLYYLKEHPSVCLVDANRLGSGVTARMTGKLTYLQGTIYTDLLDNLNEEIAKSYLESQQEAIYLAKEIIEKENIDCNLEKVISHTFTNKESEVIKIKREQEFLERQKIKVVENDLPFKNYKYAIGVMDTYVFNPVKYINGLKEILKDKSIYENTKITKIEYLNGKYLCKTENGIITSKKVIVACHYPFFNFPFWLPLKSHIEKSYIVACKTEKNEKYSCITVSNPALSIRFYEDANCIYKIYLASSHNTAFKQNDEKNFKKVKEIFQIEEEIVQEWSNVDIITDDKLAFIGALKKNFYIATGFNTWGISNGILAGKILSDLVKGKENKYEELFSLHRKNLYKVKSFFGNVSTSLIAMIGSKFKHKKWYSKRLRFSSANGKSIAIYTDKEKKEHTVYTTCPHFGCSLIFNEKELTWDCPCHSSKFDLDGKCIKGPSLYDISYKSK